MSATLIVLTPLWWLHSVHWPFVLWRRGGPLPFIHCFSPSLFFNSLSLFLSLLSLTNFGATHTHTHTHTHTIPALSAYQRYQQLSPFESSTNTSVTYGLGLIYFNMNSYKWQVDLFLNTHGQVIPYAASFFTVDIVYKLAKLTGYQKQPTCLISYIGERKCTLVKWDHHNSGRSCSQCMYDPSFFCFLCSFGVTNLLYNNTVSVPGLFPVYNVPQSLSTHVDTNASNKVSLLFSMCRAIDCFNKVLSQSSTFARAGEIHLRLGVMFKTKGDYLLSMNHFQKALAITGPASFSRLESKCVSLSLSTWMYLGSRNPAKGRGIGFVCRQPNHWDLPPLGFHQVRC